MSISAEPPHEPTVPTSGATLSGGPLTHTPTLTRLDQLDADTCAAFIDGIYEAQPLPMRLARGVAVGGLAFWAYHLPSAGTYATAIATIFVLSRLAQRRLIRQVAEANDLDAALAHQLLGILKTKSRRDVGRTLRSFGKSRRALYVEWLREDVEAAKAAAS